MFCLYPEQQTSLPFLRLRNIYVFKVRKKKKYRRFIYIICLSQSKPLLIEYCLSSFSIIFHSYRDVTIAGEGLHFFLSLLGAYDIWVGRSPSLHIRVMKHDLDLHGVIRKAALLKHLLRLARGTEDLLLARSSCNNVNLPYFTRKGYYSVGSLLAC